jgi:hypothetical protein
MHKKQSQTRGSNNSSCDVSYSVCEDSVVQEETSISQKIKSVNCHNHNSHDSVKGQLQGILQQIDGLLLPNKQAKSMHQQRRIPICPQSNYLQTFGGNKSSKH